MNEELLKSLKNKKILVLGFARSGYQTAKILHKHGIEVIVNSYENLNDNLEANELKQLGIDIVSGEHPIFLLDNIDLIIKNPGIPYKIEILKEAIKRNISIFTEIEVASSLYNNEIIAITGTNGKTTTTTLIYEILKQDRNTEVKVAGNIGYPLIEVMDNAQENDLIILEVSSFQLNGVDKFRPNIAIITNLEEAHLDYHSSKDEYHKIKKRIFKNQTEDNYLILNIKDKDLYKNDIINSRVIYYSLDNSSEVAYIEDDWFIFNQEKIFNKNKLSLLGNHNLENCINAAIVSKIKGVSNKSITDILYNFSGVAHRMQYVGDNNGVKYYNDSKATNPTSTSKALSGFEKNVILICGGQDRGVDFKELESQLSKLKALICIGESKSILANLGQRNNLKTILAEKVADATKIAENIADKDDIILLSPACASWDQYKNFEERGEEFINTFNNIKNKSDKHGK
ncbi:UDP-N-acetylmuramoyl-L-alanine--D-glutamate ligase [Gemelliphila palaticanis]|uniref:UDP-N-acetylmuramoylalanine--D-glutamate ligase n=1 Tax=Gemelliphila palaticanis TaxID=81950 RepID=A0ABX2T176_9BACL|nr:UDP-N-acetylmuramoyl-L-alanine--D-glutamate ligase [Gemella palaticanis]MBF0715030.1 UDP-N-acetylmuramoyl-L-alanine--D-glutamate ligase [Gemella palaticanis]NYS46960.1 UDP-N-acetylmuramoyl-L-alanine--D-glutamate ligase [Gemella palaticanis]